MIPTVLLTAALMLGMLLPYLPGRYDASAATLSFLIQVASHASLLLTPVGLGWIVSRRRTGMWHRLTWVLAGFIVLVTAIAAAAVNQLAMGVMLGIGAFIVLRDAHRRTRAEVERMDGRRHPLPVSLAVVPVLLVTFLSTVLPRAAEWSRDRAIEHSASLIAEIESFRQRRGHYPVSLQSLNRDTPTGVVGIERFHYEANGEAYNVFYVRPSIALDAKEVVMFNPRDEHRFASHELDILQYDGEQLDRRRGDGRRTRLPQSQWVSILFD
jgi:hypothetical protein